MQPARILGIVADSERPKERGTAMLTLTENAGTVVSDLVARGSETDTAGLRIQQGENRFDIAIAEAPAPSEVVVEREMTFWLEQQPQPAPSWLPFDEFDSTAWKISSIDPSS